MKAATNTERWRVLSDWHSTWLAAPAEDRVQLRASFAREHPDLLQMADELAASSDAVDGFLETPALALAARDLAEDEPPLPDGSLVGPYRIVALLARGGMGDVYRATDPRLDRNVALKMLTNAERGDGHAVERFLQEARITASFDHSNIVQVFDVGMSNGRPYLVSELLDGETLRAPIDRGPVAPADVRRIASALTSGLVAAHARGLVHRDLKPENVFLTTSGTAKILDFGIAKLAQDPALPHGLTTLTGVVLGTAGYLAPEQVKGDPVDARTDLFALGSILFELMTGQRAFGREHMIDTLHAIVHDDPPDLLPRGTALAAIVRRLLAKAPDARFQSAADLLWTLEQIDASEVAAISPPVPPARRSVRRTRGWAIAGAVVSAMVLLALNSGRFRQQPQSSSAAPSLTQFTWSLPAGAALDSAPIVSPDGRRIAVTAVSGNSTPRLYVRALDSLDATAIAGTDGAKQPFWSPDGTSLGFFARGKLMKVTIAGGVPIEICDAPDGKGGAWSPTGTIVFGPSMIFEGLARVSADGGPVQPATLVDFDRGENSHRWPVFLPDGIHFLYYVRASIDERRGVYVASIDRPASTPGTPLFRSESEAVFVPTSGRERGVLLSAADGQLQARPFDATTLRLVGDPRTLPVTAGANTPYHSAMLSASADLLATVATPMPYGVRLGTVLRDGTAVRLSERQPQNWPRLSPDGRRMARQVVDPARGNPDILVEDLQDGSLVRITTGTDSEVFPVWSPDGRQLAYGSGTLKDRRLSIAAADGTGVAQELACPGAYCEPTDWSPDGRHLIVNTRLAMTGASAGDVWRVPLETGGSAEPILSGPFPEYDARISPKGQWLAYVSEEAGRPEVSVRSMAGPPSRLVVSSDGGSQPVWRRDGHELLYVDLEGRLRGRSVHRQPTGELTLGVAKALSVPLIGSGHWGTQYDVSPDGQRLYFIDRTPAPRPSDIRLVIGWRALLSEMQSAARGWPPWPAHVPGSPSPGTSRSWRSGSPAAVRRTGTAPIPWRSRRPPIRS
jgi:serine/threonine protein kinase/Tol biopolymer transport system component